jgi:hypothetical protein
MHYIQAELVEQAVFDFLSDKILLPEHLLRVLQAAQPDYETRQVLDREALRLAADLADVRQVSNQLVDAVERGGYSSSLTERLAEREADRSRLRVRLSQVQRRLEQTKADVPVAVVEDFCTNAREALQHGALDDIRTVLRSIVIRVEVEPDGGRLIYKFPFLVEL